MVLIGLFEPEVGGATYLEAVLPIQLEQGRCDEVQAPRRCVRIHIGLEEGRKGLSHAQVAVIEPLVSVNEFFPLDDKDKLLDGVVKIHLNGGRVLVRGDGVRGCVLDLLDNVFMGRGDETAAFLRIQVDELAPQKHARNLRRTIHLGGARRLPCWAGGRKGVRRRDPEQLLEGPEGNVDADGGVLEGDEGQVEAGVLTEIELEGDEEAEAAGGGAGNEIHGLIGFDPPNHFIQGLALGCGRRELRPYLHPFSCLTVNLLLSHLEGDLLDEGMTDRVGVGEGVARTVSEERERHVQGHTTQEIATTGNETGDALAEIGGTVKVHGHGLGGEMGMTAVDHFKKTDLGVAR